MVIASIGMALVLRFQQTGPFEFKDTEKSVIIQKFVEQEMPKGTRLKVSPLIKGKASVKVDRAKFDIMFSNLMQQLGTTYRYEAGNWYVMPKAVK
jgi:hypothetical protein